MSTTPKFCPECGAPLAAGAKFCAACGTSVAANAKISETPVPKADVLDEPDPEDHHAHKAKHAGGKFEDPLAHLMDKEDETVDDQIGRAHV